MSTTWSLGFPGGTSDKEPPANARVISDVDLVPGSGRSPRGGHSNLLQYSCLENPMDREPGGLWSMGSHRVGHD